MDDYLEKPLDPEELIQLVESWSALPRHPVASNRTDRRQTNPAGPDTIDRRKAEHLVASLRRDPAYRQAVMDNLRSIGRRLDKLAQPEPLTNEQLDDHFHNLISLTGQLYGARAFRLSRALDAKVRRGARPDPDAIAQLVEEARQLIEHYQRHSREIVA
jgi:hypothetical protein